MIRNRGGFRRHCLGVAGMLLAAAVLPAGTNTWTGSQLRLGREAALVASHPRDPDVVYAVFQPDLYRSGDGGRSWKRVASFNRIDSLLVHPASPGTVYVGSLGGAAGRSGVSISTDEGRTWSRSEFAEGVNALAGDPRDASTVFAGTSTGRIYKSTDAGRSWPSWTHVADAVATLVVDPHGSEVLYAGTETEASYYYSSSYTFGTLIKSSDGGATWRYLRTQDLDRIAAIAIDSSNSEKLYLGLESDEGNQLHGLFRSDNGGVSIQPVRNGLPQSANVSSVVIDPANPSTIYAGTDRGIYRSRDSGESWFPFGQALAFTRINALALSPDGRRIHAGTLYGEYDVDLASGPIDLAAGEAGRSHVLSWNADRLSVLTLSEAGTWEATPAEGPSPAWTAIAIASARDDSSRVLWQHGDGRFALEIVGPEGRLSASSFSASSGYTPADLSVGSDGRTHVLWTSTHGRMSVGTIDGAMEARGTQYGPTAGWSAIAISDDADGRTWVLWRSVDGRAAVSLHRDGGLVATFRFSAVRDFTAEDIAIGSDGRGRVLATNVGGQMQIWTVEADGARSVGETRGSLGLRPRRISAGQDGLTRVLWSDAAGRGDIQVFDSNGTLAATDAVPVEP